MGIPLPNLSEFASNIERNVEGLWTARAVSSVSYPEDGNQLWEMGLTFDRILEADLLEVSLFPFASVDENKKGNPRLSLA